MRPMDLRQAMLAIPVTSALLLGLSMTLPASAQGTDYPNRKITFVVGFAPGGGIDTMARVLAQELTEQFGYQIVVENRPGAASNIAARAVANAAPDGYTLLVTGNSLAINQTYYKNPGYTIGELTPVAFPAVDSQALAVNASSPARTLSDFLTAFKGKVFSFGFGGSSARIVGEYVFKVLLKTSATGVPFQSGVPAMNALLGNHVDIIAGPVAEIFPQAQQGAMRALAVTGASRARSFPTVPTLSESGLSGLEINGWNAVLAPAKVPPEIAAKLNKAINTAVMTPAVHERLRGLGYEPHAMALADAPIFLKTSVDTWRRMIRATGISEN